jgi:hypothetical protein
MCPTCNYGSVTLPVVATSRQAPKTQQQRNSQRGRLYARKRPIYGALYGGKPPLWWACPKCGREVRVSFGPLGRRDKVYFECHLHPQHCRWRRRPMPHSEYVSRLRAADRAWLGRIVLDD